MDAAWLSIVVCPETRQPLRQAGVQAVAEVNRRVEAGTLRNRAGQRVMEILDAGLIREDGKVLYPVRHGIPILLVDEGIEV